jgi:hypothetical protein
MSRTKCVFKVYDRGAGYFLIPGADEAAARKRAAELRINMVRMEPYTPRPWPDPRTLAARERASERGRKLAAKRWA